MAQRGRRGLSYSQKRDLWIRWKQGQPISEIARALEKNHGSIHYAISLHGGIVPVERRRSRLARPVNRTLLRNCSFPGHRGQFLRDVLRREGAWIAVKSQGNLG
jgi:hypothetical protein